MPVHDGEGNLSRALESISCQRDRCVQIVIVDCASTDRTTDISNRAAERDIRIDTVRLDTPDIAAGFSKGLTLARGSYVTVLGADDWFARGSLDRAIELAEDGAFDIIAVAHALDAHDSDGNRRARVAAPAELSVSSRDEMAASFAALAEENILNFTCGNLYRRELLTGEAPLLGTLDTVIFNTHALESAQSVCTEQGIVCHMPERSNTAAFDPQRFEQVERQHRALVELSRAFGVADAPETVTAVSRWHYRAMARCIENLCLSPHSVSSIERNARLRDMLDAESTRSSMRSLQGSAKDLGIMYGPISSGNISACLLGSWVSHNLHFLAR